MDFIAYVLLVQAFASSALAGLIWTIQLVHYPLFDRVDEDRWLEFHQSHSARISIVVGPLMAAEGLSALWLLFRRPSSVGLFLVWGGAMLVALVLGSTVLISVPFHNRLAAGFNVKAHRLLVVTNWIRTIGWTLRGIVAFVMIASYFGQ